MNGTTVAIVLELEVAGDTLSGRATGQDGESIDFTGWLGLVSAIDSLLTAAPAPVRDVRSTASRTAGDGLVRFSVMPQHVTVNATKTEGETQ